MKTMITLILAFSIMLCFVGCSQDLFPDHATNELNPEQIWSITDTNDFVIAMSEHLDKKTQYGSDLSGLSEAERTFYITQTLEMEVNNGGFSQYFFNASGDFANELVSAFTAIGAVKTASICQKAINAFGQDLPVDWDARQEMLSELENDEVSRILTECDDAFYAYEEDLNELNYQFVMNNKDQFT